MPKMDSLPVELLRLIFEYCDAATVQHLRLVSKTLATVGYEYLIPAHFTSLEWRDDVKRLHAISAHDQLRSSIESITFITFNFAKLDGYSTLNTSLLQHWFRAVEQRDEKMEDVMTRCYEIEKRRRGLPSISNRGSMVEEALRNLPKLKALEVTYKYPYDMDILEHSLWVRSCRERDRVQACKNMNAIISAIRHVRLSSLVIDQLPLELFKIADDRKHWFDCARSFASLSRLDLVVDPPSNMLPQARFRAVNGLGHVIEFAPNLTRLSLGFQNPNNPVAKFALRLEDMFGYFTFKKLTDLKLEGISCSEQDLRSFLIRHSSTLERLRLGGRGMAEPDGTSIGGIHLHEGTWRSFFSSLRGKLPRLERFHMEGDCEAGEIRTTSREVYKFHAVADDNWEAVPVTRSMRNKSIDSRELERFLLRGGEYPKLVFQDE